MTWNIPATTRRRRHRLVAMINLAMLLMVTSSAANFAWPDEDLFEPAITISLGDQRPHFIESGDFNEDGVEDLITGNRDDYSISILIGAGDGTFEIGNTYSLTGRPWAITVGDVHDDDHLDFVVMTHSEPELIVFRGNGRGGFAEDWFYSDLSGAYDVELGDTGLDGDHDLDLAISQPEIDEVSLFTNDGDGTFTLAESLPISSIPDEIIFADLTGDGHLDLVVTEHIHNVVYISIFEDGNYRPPIEYPVWFDPNPACAGDLDNDGDLDLAVRCSDGIISILENSGDGTFGIPTNIDTYSSFTYSIKIGDLDLDGNQDLAMSQRSPYGVMILLGNGDMTFRPPQQFETGNDPWSIVLDDFDRDFDLDLVSANDDDRTLSVLLNTTLTPKSIIAGPGPAEGNPPLVRTFPPRPGAGYTVEFSAYGAQSYGVNVSCGNLGGSGMGTILTGAGPGEVYGPHVRGFNPDGTPLEGVSFLAYGTNHWGVNVAAGDIDGDSYDEIVTGAGPGEVFGPHVRGWDYDGAPPVTSMPGVSFFAYGTPKWGVNVTAGDIDGDGYDEIVTGPGPGAVYGPHVRGWNVDGGAATAIPGVSFLAYGTNRYGVEVSCGDVDGDGIDEIVTGAGPGQVFGAHVRGWDYDGVSITQLPGFSFFAWPPDQLRFGARVHAGTDLNGDFRAELVVGPGPDSRAGTPIKVFGYDGKSVVELFSLEAFPGLTQGTSVGAGSM